jgi:hypothetical protein
MTQNHLVQEGEFAKAVTVDQHGIEISPNRPG